MSKVNDPEQAFVDSVRQRLEASESTLDDETLGCLRQARRRALEQLSPTPSRVNEQPLRDNGWGNWFMPVSGVAATAVIAILAFTLTTQDVTQAPPQDDLITVLDDMAILGAEEDMELFQDLDFYEWLASQDGNELG